MRQKYTFYTLLAFCLLLQSACATKYYTKEYIEHVIFLKRRKEELKKEKKDIKEAVKKALLEEKTKRKEEIKQKREQHRRQRQQAREKKQQTARHPTPPTSVADSTKPKVPRKDTTNTSKQKEPTPASQDAPKPRAMKFVLSKKAIKDVITQSARSEAIWDASGNIRVIGNTNNQMKGMDLTADTLIYNVHSGKVIALPKRDSNNQLVKKIDFKQGKKKFRLEKVIFNPKTKKALMYDVQTKEGDLYVHSEKVKRTADSIYFGNRSVFSTCDYFPPHFDFRTNRYKLVQGKVIVTGSLYAYFEGVPLPPKIPLLPFAILPMPKERNSGLIIPEIINDGPRGFGLQNGGYYFVLGQYADLRVTASYFALGDYNLTLSSLFTKKYLLKNNLYLDFQFSRQGSPGDADFSENIGYKIKWSFQLDPKVIPSVSLQASLNFISSSTYNRYATQLNANDRLNNIFSSSISFSKRWKRGPIQQLSVSGTHSQNTTSKKIDISLPSINLQTRQYNPLDLFSNPLHRASSKWYNKFRISYSLQFSNRASLSEDQFDIFKLIDTSRWSATHNFPLTLALPQLGFLNLTPSVTYNQKWHDLQTEYVWRSETNTLDTITRKGIFPEHNFSLGMAFNVKDLIASLQFKKSRIKAIRHILRISGNISYKPDLTTASNFYTTQIDKEGKTNTYNYYGSGSYVKQEAANLSFSVKNVIQAKWNKRTPKGDTTKGEERKVDILNVDISGSYNLIADSLNLSDFSINFTTNISKKISVSGQATFDPYYYNISGRKTPAYVWEEGVRRRLPQTATTGDIGVAYLASLSSSISLSFAGKKKNEKQSNSRTPAEITQTQLPSEHTERHQIINETRETIRANPSAFVDFNIPWSLRLGVNARYRREFNQNRKMFDDKYTVNATVGGSISLTKKWQLTYSGSINLDDFEITRFEFGLTRDLHCWTMSIRVVPVGPYKQFGFTIQPKSRILQDLKIDPKHFF